MKWMFGAVLATCWATVGIAGPFGVEMGDSISDYKTSETGNKVTLEKVPNPHPDFEIYSVWHTENSGICRVLAVSSVFKNDRYGGELKTWMTKTRSALEKKYGDSSDYSFLRPGALWDELDEFTMSLYKNERQHAFGWELAAAPIEGVGMIQLYASGLGSDSSVGVLEYRSPTFDQCLQEIEDGANSSF